MPVVYGVYCSTRLQVHDGYSGDDDTFIFSLLPACRSFRASETSTRCFVSFDSSRSGIGFGGSREAGHRIWLDRRMATNSYINDGQTDDTFERGLIGQSSSAHNQQTDV